MSTYQEKTPSTNSFKCTQTVSVGGTIHGIYFFKPHGDMMEIEEAAMDLMNAVGRSVLKPSLASFDVVGLPITVGGIKFYSRGQFPQVYQTVAGPISVERHVYQSSMGGRTFVPLENKANLVLNSTPQFGKVALSKMANMPSTAVETDFADNHRRPVSRDYLKSLSDSVGGLAKKMEEFCEYADPINVINDVVKTISVSLDMTTILFIEDSKKISYREAMVGVISLIDNAGERLHTIYLGSAPEYGQESFLDRLVRELSRAKVRYPDAFVPGIADGAAFKWTFLESRTQTQVLDFYHLSTYVNKAAEELFPKKFLERQNWSDDWLHKIKYSNNRAIKLSDEIQDLEKS